MIFKILSLLLILAFLIGPTNTLAGETSEPEARIVELLNAAGLSQGVVKVVQSEIPGIYQILLKNGHVIYVFDQNPPYLIVGKVMRYSPGLFPPFEDIAEKLVNEMVASVLPELKKLAIKVGSGPVEVIEISDPDCPFCRRLHGLLKQYKENVTRYVILYPLPIHPEARDKAMWILASEDEAPSRYESVMDGTANAKIDEDEVKTSPAYGEASARLALMMEKVQPFVQGTPVVIINGKVIHGFNEPLIRRLISNNTASSN